MAENLFESAGRLFFSRERIKELERELNTAGVNMPPDSFAGYIGLNIIIVTIFLTVLLLLYSPTSDFMKNTVQGYVGLPFELIAFGLLILCFLMTYAATLMLISSYLMMKADSRREKLEAALPDFLTLVASNIKAGMTLDQAMWYSAKPEFGLLSNEVKAVIKGAFSGESLEGALDRLGARFDSRVFKRTILLLKQATATGGALTEVLERTTDDVRNTIIMKKEIAASLMLYEIFVLFAAIVGTPFLFAVAGKLIQVFERIGLQLGGSVTGAATVAISSTDFFWFTMPTIFVTALISSFIVSVIRTGTKSQGMKYFPFVLVLSYLVYWVVSSGIESFFATLA